MNPPRSSSRRTILSAAALRPLAASAPAVLAASGTARRDTGKTLVVYFSRSRFTTPQPDLSFRLRREWHRCRCAMRLALSHTGQHCETLEQRVSALHDGQAGQCILDAQHVPGQELRDRQADHIAGSAYVLQ